MARGPKPPSAESRWSDAGELLLGGPAHGWRIEDLHPPEPYVVRTYPEGRAPPKDWLRTFLTGGPAEPETIETVYYPGEFGLPIAREGWHRDEQAAYEYLHLHPILWPDPHLRLVWATPEYADRIWRQLHVVNDVVRAHAGFIAEDVDGWSLYRLHLRFPDGKFLDELDARMIEEELERLDALLAGKRVAPAANTGPRRTV